MTTTTVADVGLTSAQVAERVSAGQVNATPATSTRTVGQILRANVLTPFNALLGSMFVLIVIFGSMRDGLFGLVLVANAAIGIVQELRAKRTLDRLAVLTAPRATVLRDGTTREVAVGEVVLDDVVEASQGDQIVVDGITLDSQGFEVDESLLTGESDPVHKEPGDELLSGSFVASGSGRYRATRVGSAAYAASLAERARQFTLVTSELRDGVNRVLKYVSLLILPTAALLFWSQYRAHGSFRESVSGAVAGTVAMVPEGLVLLMSVAFAAAVVRLGRQRVLVRELPAVEGLARVDVLCIDKTGTLTEGRMDVLSVEPLEGFEEAALGAALGAFAANDPAPNATMRAIGERFRHAPDGWVRIDAVPFSSARKWSAMSFADRGAWLLGGPDVLAPPDGEVATRAQASSDEGHRVVLLAWASALTGESIPGDLAPAGLVTLSERLRPSAAETLRYFARQDVAVKVISGDNPRTVGAIAARLGLPGAAEPMDARDLPQDGGLAAAVRSPSVFGRVTPQQKRDMVRALQANGHVVAMTGDGVNDALALKDADVGVAMGSGSEATRGVAQLVLLDSDFSALPSVVAEGRRVLGNIERTSSLYLTKTSYSLVLALATGVASLVFPFLPRHLTLIAVLTIGVPSFFLALAPNAERFRRGFIPRVLRFAAPAGFLAGAATLLSYTLARHEPGLSLPEERTTAVMTLVWVGLAVLTVVAAPLTPRRLALIWTMAAALPTVLLVPGLRRFFELEVPPLLVWLAAIGIAALVWSMARLFVPVVAPRPAPAGGATDSG